MECLNQQFQVRHQFLVHENERQLESSRISIIGRLGHIHMVIRVAVLVLTFLMSHQFQGAIGYYLIDIHIRRSPCSPLNQINGELVMQFTADNLFAGMRNGICNIVRQNFQFLVCLSCCPFYHCQCLHIVRVIADGNTANVMEILNATQGLDTIICLCRHFFFA